MDKNPWTGRLAVEVTGKMGGCCVGTIVKWRPQNIGEKRTCSYCESYLKTIRAGEVLSPVFTGGILEHHREVAEPELTIGGLYFASGRFASEEAVRKWMADRDMAGDVAKVDEHAFYLPVDGSLMADSVRLVWVAPGVVGEIGVSEKQVAVGGGQASMSSPGITTTSIASGGDLFPAQGPAASAAVVEGVPSLIQGITDAQDGHQHEYFLTPVPEVAGWRVKSFTSFNNGHAHMIECAVGSGGEIDTRTAPDQTPVGGHAHSHRVAWPIGKSDGGEPEGQDADFVHKTMGAVDGFCKDVLGGGAMQAMSDFRAKMDGAIERARGASPGVAPSGEVIDAVSDAAGMGNPGNVESLVEWVGEKGFDGCVAAIKGSRRASEEVDDPVKVCGWLKGQAKKKGKLAPEHAYGKKKE